MGEFAAEGLRLRESFGIKLGFGDFKAVALTFSAINRSLRFYARTFLSSRSKLRGELPRWPAC